MLKNSTRKSDTSLRF